MVFKKKMGVIITLKNIFHSVLDFFFPQICVTCQSKLYNSNFSICNECVSKIEKANPSDIENIFHQKISQFGTIEGFFSHFEFTKGGKCQRVIHELKYNKKSNLGIYLGILLGKELSKKNWFPNIELIIPVPIHYIKKLSRGYNQSDKICEGIQKVTNKNYYPKVVKRKKFTQTQTLLTISERIKNVSGAFKVRDVKKIRNKTILIVDDVFTTGSTVNELAKTLLNSGAKVIFLATLAFVKDRDFTVY